MKFSDTFLIFPTNRALQTAVAQYNMQFPPQNDAEEVGAEQRLQNNVIHTLGCFELPLEHAALPDDACERVSNALEEQDANSPQQTAALQYILGNLLATRAQQQQDDALYEQSIKAFQSALEIYSQQDNPQEWAWAQYGLGASSYALGSRQQNAALLKQAVDAGTNALLVWTRQDNPLEWALTMHQLGVTFHAHGTLLKGNRTLQKSVVAFKNALAELNEEDSGLELVATHNNRGAVLHNLGESEDNPDRIEEAIRAYDAALDSCMAQQLSIHLANICRINMATSKCVVAQLKQDAAVAEEAADELEVIIECFGDSCQPRYIAHCEQQLRDVKNLMEELSKAETGA